MGSASPGSHDISTAWVAVRKQRNNHVFYANYKAETNFLIIANLNPKAPNKSQNKVQVLL